MTRCAAPRRRFWPCASLLVAGLFLAALVPAATADDTPPKLVGIVGPGFTIDLQYPDGTHVTVARRREVRDSSSTTTRRHPQLRARQQDGNAALFQTEVPFVGDQTFTVDFPPGLYAYACSPHFDDDERHFTVTCRAAACVDDEGADREGRRARRRR